MLPPKVSQQQQTQVQQPPMQPPQVQQPPIPQHVPYVDVQRQRWQRPPSIGIFESIIGIIVLVMSALMLMLGQALAVLMIGSSELTMFSAVHEIEAILLIGLGSIGLAQGTMLLRKKQN